MATALRSALRPALARAYIRARTAHRAPIRTMSTSTSTSTAAKFPCGGPGPVIVTLSSLFQNDITSLLSANTESVPEQPVPFDTAFDNTFAPDVRASVNGTAYSRAELKTFLLGIRNSLNGETADFVGTAEHRAQDSSEAVRHPFVFE